MNLAPPMAKTAPTSKNKSPKLGKSKQIGKCSSKFLGKAGKGHALNQRALRGAKPVTPKKSVAEVSETDSESDDAIGQEAKLEICRQLIELDQKKITRTEEVDRLLTEVQTLEDEMK